MGGESWNSPVTIIECTDWFINWADFPSLTSYRKDKSIIAAHWLEMSTDGTYDYDMRFTQSVDEGKTWSEPFTPHKGRIPAEHGFVSMIPVENMKLDEIDQIIKSLGS